MATTKDILLAARKLIENEDDWFGGSRNPVTQTEHCAMLALNAVEPNWDRYAEAITALAAVCAPSKRGGFTEEVVAFNNSHTHAEVLAAFDRAIALSDHQSGGVPDTAG